MLVVSGIQGFGIQNRAQVLRNPTKVWNPESTEKDWNRASGIHNPRNRIQNPRLSCNPKYGAIVLDCERRVTIKYAHIKAIRPSQLAQQDCPR